MTEEWRRTGTVTEEWRRPGGNEAMGQWGNERGLGDWGRAGSVKEN